MGICCTNTLICMCVCVLLTSQMTPEKGLNLIKVFCLFTVDNSRVELARPTGYSVIVCTTRRGVGWHRSLYVCVCVCVARDGVCVDMTVSTSRKREVRGRQRSGDVAADATSVCTSLSPSWLLIFALSIRSRFSQVTIYHLSLSRTHFKSANVATSLRTTNCHNQLPQIVIAIAELAARCTLHIAIICALLVHFLPFNMN